VGVEVRRAKLESQSLDLPVLKVAKAHKDQLDPRVVTVLTVKTALLLQDHRDREDQKDREDQQGVTESTVLQALRVNQDVTDVTVMSAQCLSTSLALGRFDLSRVSPTSGAAG
jgi:hypothetical protein